MKQSHTTYRLPCVLLVVLVVSLLSAHAAVAATSSVYNEITVESNSGNSHNTTAQVEVTSITTINGAVSSYHFATSSTGTIEHSLVRNDVAVHDLAPTVSTTAVSVPTDFDHLISAADTVTTPTDFAGWLQLLRNFLTHYVATAI